MSWHRISAFQNFVVLDKWLNHSKSYLKLEGDDIPLIRLLTLVSYVCKEFPTVAGVITNNKAHDRGVGEGRGALNNIWYKSLILQIKKLTNGEIRGDSRGQLASWGRSVIWQNDLTVCNTAHTRHWLLTPPLPSLNVLRQISKCFHPQ